MAVGLGVLDPGSRSIELELLQALKHSDVSSNVVVANCLNLTCIRCLALGGMHHSFSVTK